MLCQILVDSSDHTCRHRYPKQLLINSRYPLIWIKLNSAALSLMCLSIASRAKAFVCNNFYRMTDENIFNRTGSC